MQSGDVGSVSEALVDVSWTNAVGVSAVGNDLTKTDLTSTWAAGAASNETIITGNGYVEFTTLENNTSKVAGLSSDDTNQNYTDIDFGLQLASNGYVRIYEFGVKIGNNYGMYVAGDVFRISVSSGVVRYFRNGILLYTSAASPAATLLLDTSLYSPGATIQDAVIEDTGTPSLWQNVVGVTATDDDLQRPPSSGGWNSGASTVATISTDGSMVFTTAEANTGKMAGLSNGDANQNYLEIDYAFALQATGIIRIYENGVKRGNNFGTYVAGDTFRIEVVGGVVQYRHNGTLVYTSSTSPTFPLLVDTSLYTPGATIQNVSIQEAPLFQNIVGVTPNGNDLVKTSLTGWNAGASTVDSLAANGYLEFSSAEANTYKMAGLSNGDTDQNYTDIDYAFYLMNTGEIRIYENGVRRGTSYGTYVAGDVFRVENTGGTVVYSHNGTPVYTSLVMATSPLLADTALYSTNATVNDITLTDTP